MMELVISPAGRVRCLYNEAIDLSALGAVHITRASHVEPDDQGRWWADLSPVAGPRLGPFHRRSDALAAEVRWLDERLLSSSQGVADEGIVGIDPVVCLALRDRLVRPQLRLAGAEPGKGGE